MKTTLRIAVLLMAATLTQAQPPSARQNVPDGVKAFRDVAYVTNGHARQTLDLYVPEKAGGAWPLLIWVHGGGWQNGSKNGCPILRQGFVQRGYAVASIGYRLSGDAVFPAQIEDCKAAVRWLRANANTYGLNPDRFGVWGSSAGGHLVALLGTSGDEKAFDVGAHLDVSSRVQAVCDYYGPTDLTQMDAQATPEAVLKHNDPTSPESRLLGGPVLENREKAARASPVTYVSTHALPPFLIVHGDADPVVPFRQSELLFEALQKAGASVGLHRIKGAGHGQGFGGQALEEKVNGFFDRWLKTAEGKSPPPEAVKTESVAVGPAAGKEPRRKPGQAGAAQEGGRLTFDRVRAREDADGDGRVTRAEFKGPPQIFGRLDRTGDGILTKEDFTGGR